jgi:hypothetical protein
MTFTLCHKRCGCEATGRRLRNNVAGFLGFGPEDETLQPANRGLLGFD